MSNLEERTRSIDQQIEEAALRSGRSADQITLVAVSKRQSVSSMNAYLRVRQDQSRSPVLGESYVQEFDRKKPEILGEFEVHLIGHLQSNKAKDAVRLFDVIESVDSLKVAKAVQKEAAKIGKVQRIFVQVNISGDSEKSGLTPKGAKQFLSTEIAEFNSLEVLGLMAITRLYEDPEAARGDFQALRVLRDEISLRIGRDLELSMGMSGDFKIAIEEGATVVRIGSALFGSRE